MKKIIILTCILMTVLSLQSQEIKMLHHIHNGTVKAIPISDIDSITQGTKQFIVYKNGSVLYDAVLTLSDSIKFVTFTCPVNEYEFTISAHLAYTWDDLTYTASGDYVKTFKLSNGCDSTVTLHLTITGCPVASVNIDTVALSYKWNGTVYRESGVYEQTFSLEDGCDSTVTLHLTLTKYIEYNGIKWALGNVNKPGTFVDNVDEPGMFYQYNNSNRLGWSVTDDPMYNSDQSGVGWNSGTNYITPEDTGWTYNVCPDGWRVPKKSEIEVLQSVPLSDPFYKGDNNTWGWEFTFPSGEELFFPAVKERNNNGGLTGSHSYWTTTMMTTSGNTNIPYYFYFNTANTPDIRIYSHNGVEWNRSGKLIRCVKK
jgi:hypothetical protein